MITLCRRSYGLQFLPLSKTIFDSLLSINNHKTSSSRRSLKTSSTKKPSRYTVTLIPGDGVGPEITRSVVRVFAAAEIPIDWDIHQMSYLLDTDEANWYSDGGHIHMIDGVSSSARPRTQQHDCSIPVEVLDSLHKNKYGIKGTLFTPIEQKHKRSLNTRFRTELDLYANVIKCKSILPNPVHVESMAFPFEPIDIIVIRENTEGEYSAIEHELKPGIVESLRITSYDATVRIANYAFELAVRYGRLRVTTIHKANVMKVGDGIFVKACRDVSMKFPSIKYEEMVVDNCVYQLATNPERFDVMLMPNLYGNLIANIGTGIVGGAGLVGGYNLGDTVAVYEQGARHVGMDIAGSDLSNPTGILLSSVMMLQHMGLSQFSTRVDVAVRSVLAKGNVLTRDMGGDATNSKFTDEIIKELELQRSMQSPDLALSAFTPPPFVSTKKASSAGCQVTD